MYITYIVGNGLDIQYGLKTKYKNFYEFQNEIYKNKKEKNDYSNFIYEALFKDRVNDYENWSDFELSIGKLTRDNEEITKTNDAKEKFIIVHIPTEKRRCIISIIIKDKATPKI